MSVPGTDGVAGVAPTADLSHDVALTVPKREHPFRRLLRDPVAVCCLIVIALLFLLAIFGPALTVLSLQFIALIGGALVVEKVFGLNGIGSQVALAADQGDLPVVMGVVLVMVLIVVIVNLIMDVLYGWLNPKVRV